MHRSEAFGLVLAGALGLVAASVARAEPNQVRVSIEPGAPAWLEPCLAEDTLNASYRTARSGDEHRELSRSQLAVGVRTVTQKGREATLEIRAHTAKRDLGSRVLSVHANDCGAVPDAVALVLVLLSRSAAAEPAPESRPAPAPEPAPAPRAAALDPERPPALAPSPAEEEQERAALDVRAAAVFSLVWGMLPETAVGLALDGELAWRPWTARMRVQLLLPQTHRIAEGSVLLLPVSFDAAACLGSALDSLPWLGLRACIGPRLSLIHASGSGFRLQNRSPLEPALHVGSALEAGARLAASTWLRVHLDGAVALFRPRFVVEIQDVAEQSEVAGPRLLRAEAGLSVLQIF